MKEIIKSVPMMFFIGFVLGFTFLTSVRDKNLDKQKDLKRTTETSQIVNLNK